jgi:hypothetical protein
MQAPVLAPFYPPVFVTGTVRKSLLFVNAGALDTETQTTLFRRKASMFRIYFPTMLLLVATGIVFAATATAMAGLGAGLAMLTVGAGGISAGLVTRDPKRPARR